MSDVVRVGSDEGRQTDAATPGGKCCSEGCNCAEAPISRRSFLTIAGAAAATVL
ncbi:MAG: twin-arginine translocation signal domain-containing protein, partial [Phycisphaerales bacterium JB038]